MKIKKNLKNFLVSLALILNSCTTLNPDIREAYERAKAIPTRYDKPGVDDWKTPKRTEKEGGDCMCKARYLEKLLDDRGYDARTATGILRSVKGDYGHAWVVLKDKILDPFYNRITTTNNWSYLEITNIGIIFRRALLEEQIRLGQ